MITSAADWIRRQAALAGFAVVIVGGTLQYRDAFCTADFGPPKRSAKRGFESFYLAAPLQDADQGALSSRPRTLESRRGVSMPIVSAPQPARGQGPEGFPVDLVHAALDRGRVPMITWAPWTSATPGEQNQPHLAGNREGVAALLRGELDGALRAYAERLRDLGGPVLLRFAPQADDPKSPWSAGGIAPSEFRAAWEHVYRLVQERGAFNVGWVWTPGSAQTSSAYYPGDELVDWIATDIHDDVAGAPDCERRSFSQLYAPFRPRFLAYDKPVLVGELGPTACEGDRAAQYLAALTDIRSKYPEIRGLVVGEGSAAADWNGPLADAIATQLRGLGWAPIAPRGEEPRPTSPTGRRRPIRGRQGEYELFVDGRPFYIRGVAYSPDDVLSGRIPLSRRRLEEDLRAIRSMGANTIRRYGTGWYDHNILTVAHEQHLKVLMGFWLAPDVDYLEDRDAVRKYELQVAETVQDLRTYPAVLGWVLGNETWEKLDEHFGQPKLTQVRRAYAELVERLAVRIHEIDPDRPVMSALEHSRQLPGALGDFVRFAPSLDAMAVNSYYQTQLAALSATVNSFDPGRPYLTSEFGPDGYWDHDLGERQANGLLRELPGSAKAEQYTTAWTKFIAPNRGRNIGGVAYCWRDRQEGTATWFGLTDVHERRKPAYFALRTAWTGELPAGGSRVLSIQSRSDEFQVEEVAEFFAEAGADDGLVFEWSLRRDEFYDPGAALEPFEGGRAVRVQLPHEPGVYRLYLHVSGGDDRVDTASLALRVAPRGWPVARAFRGGL